MTIAQIRSTTEVKIWVIISLLIQVLLHSTEIPIILWKEHMIIVMNLILITSSFVMTIMSQTAEKMMTIAPAIIIHIIILNVILITIYIVQKKRPNKVHHDLYYLLTAQKSNYQSLQTTCVQCFERFY